MEKLFESKFVTLLYDASKKCLVQNWTTFCTTDDYKMAQLKSVDFVIAKGCKAFISDTTNASLLKKEATDWAVEVIVPKLKSQGIMHIEVVLPQSAFTKMTLSNLEKDLGSYMRYHGSLASALATL